MENRIPHILIKSMVEKALKDAKEAPERSVRNLIDLGLNFSTGKYQQRFLEVSRDLLKDESSAYYRLIRDTVADIDSENLITFGMNVGYNSCTMGARIIRRTEEKEHFNIPWLLSFYAKAGDNVFRSRQYGTLIEQGMKLGIYTYAIFSEALPSDLFAMFARYSECAFILFCSPDDVTNEFLECAKKSHNLCTIVKEGPHSAAVCHRLRHSGLLHGIYTLYHEASAPDLLNGSFLNSTEDYKPPFVAFIPEPSCPESIREAVYNYVTKSRQCQEYPSIVIDALQDALLIDEIISGDSVFLLFQSDGTVITSRDPVPRVYDGRPLKDLLIELLPKHQPAT